ncbi:MAG: FG-GAP-like repeat-containing protein [Nanoarchaeota archaeon]|nr:FG-GAP-like repeat-containing protein [Nanoarchaeota archaeon]
MKQKNLLVLILSICFIISGVNATTNEWSVEIEEDTDLSLHSPILDDLNNDGSQEIIIPSGYNMNEQGKAKVYIIKPYGVAFDGWPIQFDSHVTTVAIGDIDNDLNKEIVISTKTNIYIYSINGILENSWEFESIHTSGVSLGDLNDDGALDIFIGITNNDDDSYIYAWDYNGNELNGWPVSVGKNAWFQIFTGPSIEDINNDGKLEIVSCFLISTEDSNQTSKIYAFSKEGQSLENWPVEINPVNLGTVSGCDFGPTLADLDNDNFLEIIGISRDESGFNHNLYIFNYQGNLIKEYNSVLGESVSVGDINEDGKLEIVTNKFEVFNLSDKFDNWPPIIGLSRYSPVIGDINSDNFLEIINFMQYLPGKFEVYAFDKNAQIVSGWPKEIITTVDHIALGNLDNDRTTEIVLTFRRTVQIYKGGIFNKNKIIWPMFRHNPQQTNSYSKKDFGGHTCPEGTIWSEPQQKCVPTFGHTCPESCVCDSEGNILYCRGEATTCPPGCICNQETTTCPTEQQPVGTEIIAEDETSYSNVEISQASSGTISIKIEELEVATLEKVSVIESKMYMEISGENKQIKILPEKAVSNSKIEIVENIELIAKQEKAVYSISGTSSGKLVLVIPVTAEIKSEVDAETGEVISVTKPWWSFLASGI